MKTIHGSLTILNNKTWIIGASLAALFLTALFMLTRGTAGILPTEVLTVLAAKLGLADQSILTTPHGIIIWDIRWPRIALAMLAGSALAVSGACYQTMFRNPLADPFILGVSSGAALGAALAIVFFHTAYLPVYAFLGGGAAVTIVFFLGRQDEGADAQQLLLAGIAFGSMLNALLSLTMAVFSQQIHLIVFWLMGSLANPVDNLSAIAAIVLFGVAVILVYARDLDLIAFGDDTARHLGVNLTQVKLIVLAATTLITSTVVAVSGIIGFVGLIVPHIVRKLTGPEHSLLLPVCAIWGSLLLLWADGVTRFFTTLVTVPVGVVTALFGGPFFLYILFFAGKGR